MAGTERGLIAQIGDHVACLHAPVKILDVKCALPRKLLKEWRPRGVVRFVRASAKPHAEALEPRPVLFEQSANRHFGGLLHLVILPHHQNAQRAPRRTVVCISEPNMGLCAKCGHAR